ncbi:MAG: hypothetical protein Q7S75_01040 [bacterium]|nr:hypothetical protein [bacterium]
MDINEVSGKGFNFRKVPQEDFSQYSSSGGILDERDYKGLLALAKDKGMGALPMSGQENGTEVNADALKEEAKQMVQDTGVVLNNDWDVRTLIFLMLSTNDAMRAKYQGKLGKKEQILAEALRISGDTVSRNAVKQKYSNTSFSDRN